MEQIAYERRENGHVGIVFPPDVRVRVDPTHVEPFYWVGQLDIEFPSARGTGTGTLIGPNRVLTCAHNLYNHQYGGWARRVTFSLARNGVQQPYGFPKDVLHCFVPESYRLSPPPDPQNGNVRDYTRYLSDFAVVVTDGYLDPSGIGLYPELWPANDGELHNRPIDITGYPGDKPRGTMWNGAGRLLPIDHEFLFYQVSTYNGQSGSAVRTLAPRHPANLPRVIGVHVAGSEHLGANFACRITPERFDLIQSWL